MPFQIVRNDITRVKADILVNTANREPLYAGGTDHAIYQAAGAERLLAERRKIGIIERGEIAVTPAFDLKAKYIIHVSGPEWIDGQNGEYDILRSCYEKALIKAAELKCESIAFPLIATGVNGFPRDQALQIAIHVISTFLMTHEMTVILVVFSRAAFELSGQVFSDVASFIDDVQVQNRYADEYGADPAEYERIRRNHAPCLRGKYFDPSFADDKDEYPPEAAAADADFAADGDLEQLLSQMDETFQQCLFRMIDERGMKDTEVYKRANIDRKHFSKIRCDPDYHPKKKTALAFAIALRLDLEETKELLSKAEWALSSSSKFDIIVTYFIRNRIYDIYQVNLALFDHHQNTLGA